MNSVTPTPTPSPTPSPTQTHNNLNSSLIEADFAVGIILVIIGTVCFIIQVIDIYANKDVNPGSKNSDENYIKKAYLNVLYTVLFIISGIFLILTSQNKHRYVDFPQNSVNEADIKYGIVLISLGCALLIIISIISYYKNGPLISYLFLITDLGFVATLFVTGFEYLISGEFFS